MGERFAFQVLHYHKINTVLMPNVVERADVRMTQARDGLGFTIEAFAGLRAIRLGAHGPRKGPPRTWLVPNKPPGSRGPGGGKRGGGAACRAVPTKQRIVESPLAPWPSTESIRARKPAYAYPDIVQVVLDPRLNAV